MHLELLIPDLIAPRAEAMQGLALPALQKLLGRGRRQITEAVSVEHWLCDAAGLGDGAAAPLAAISFLGDGGSPGARAWLRADPVHLRAERDQLLLDLAPAATLNADDAAALVKTLNQHFAADGLQFHAPGARRWYVETATVPEVTLVPVSALVAAGNNVDALRPSGRDAMAWQRIANEAQMLLHEHPANLAREDRGELPINGVWLWGAGRLPARINLRYSRILSDDPVALGIAMLGNVATGAPPASAKLWLAGRQADHGRRERELIVFGGLREAVRDSGVESWRSRLEDFERDWFAPLLHALRREDIGMLTIHALAQHGSLSAEIIRGDLVKFWRGARPLAAYADLGP